MAWLRPTTRGKVNFKWESDIHDFGAFNEDVGRVTCQFKGVNLGPDTASVIYLNASCGCTTPRPTNGSFLPATR